MKFNGKTLSAFYAGYAYDPTEVIEETAEHMKSQFASCIMSSARGEVLSIADASDNALQGFTLYGKTTESGNAGSDGSITITATGKNLLDTSENAIKEVSFTAANGTVSGTYWGIELILPAGEYVMQAHINASGATSGYLYGIINDLNGNFLQGDFHPVFGGSLLTRRTTLSKTAKVILYDVSGTIESGRTKASAVLSFSRFDIQLEIGTTPTAFESYKCKTLAVYTPNGLAEGEQLVVEDFSELHTYKPYTTIFNNAGAEMAVEYVADTKAYIDNKFTELQNAILSSGANV